MKLALAIIPALFLSACSFDLSPKKQKDLPTEVVLHGQQYLKLPKQYPSSNQTVNMAKSVAKKLWEIPLGNNPIVNCQYQNGYVFVATSTDLLYMIDANTGEIKWITNTNVPATFPVGISKNRIYYNAGNVIVEADLFTGRKLNVKRELQNIAIPAYGVGYYSSNIFVTSDSGRVQSHKLTGRYDKKWLREVPEWFLRSKGELTGSIVVIPPYIYFSNKGGELKRISALTGEKNKSLAFTRKGFKPIHPPVPYDDTLFQTFTDNTLYAVNRHSMLANWSYPMGIPLNQSPLVSENNIAIMLTDGVDVIDFKGKKRYHSDLVKKPLCFDKDCLIAISKDNKIISLDKNGKLLWTRNKYSEKYLKPGSENGMIVVSYDKKNIAFYATGYIKKPNDFRIIETKINMKDKKAEVVPAE